MARLQQFLGPRALCAIALTLTTSGASVAQDPSQKISDADKKDIEGRWMSIAESFRKKDRELLFSFFSDEAVKWLETEEAAGQIKPLLAGHAEEYHDFEGLFLVDQKSAAAMTTPELFKRFAVSALLITSQVYSDGRLEGMESRLGEVELSFKDRFGRRGRVILKKDGANWGLSKSFVASLPNWYLRHQRALRLGVALSRYSAKQCDYPEKVSELETAGLITSSEVARLEKDYVYLYPLEGDGAPPERWVAFERLSSDDGSRLILTAMGADWWVSESVFQSLLAMELETVSKEIDGQISTAQESQPEGHRACSLQSLKKTLVNLKK